MTPVDFYWRSLRLDHRKFILWTAVSAIANTAIIAVINAAADDVLSQASSSRFLLLFLLAIALYMVTTRYLLLTATSEVEEAIHGKRLELVHSIRQAEVLDLEEVGRAEIYASVTSDTSTLSDAAIHLVTAFQSVFLTAFVLLYIATLSVPALFLILGFAFLGAQIHLRRRHQINDELVRSMEEEDRLHGGVEDLLAGFKEVKQHRGRSVELGQWLDRASAAASAAKKKVSELQSVDFMLSQVTIFLLIGVIVFVVPSLGTLDSTLVIKVLAATQFLVGPMSAVVAAVPVTAKARAALQRLTEIEASLARAAHSGGEYDPAASFADFQRIELAGVRFRYGGEDRGFEIGPVDLTFERGETVFLIGGNGSGKSTLIRLLLGLYRPQEGEIRVDGVAVTDRNFEAYRALFSPVFSDNHLFQHLFGIPAVSATEARELLELLELDGKASIEGRSFSTVRLSGGQRKRLALLVSVLEKRPVVVLDEWAADQDPVFRRKFYEEIVGRLTAAGKTVIAATHDDLYFDRAARIVALRDGAIESDSSTDRPTDPTHRDDDGRPS